MIDIKNIEYKPDIEEVREYIGSDLFEKFYQYMNEMYQPIMKIEFSKDVWAPGWNVKFRKSSKSLCVIYPKEGYFTILVVVGKKEKEQAESVMSECSEEMQQIYRDTKEGNGQRWLMIDLHCDDGVYRDVLKLIHIRRFGTLPHDEAFN